MNKEFSTPVSKIADLMSELRIGYVNSRIAKPENRELIFANHILKTLNNHYQIIGILSTILRKDIINSIHTHHLKYVHEMEKKPELQNKLAEFNKCYNELKENLIQEQKIKDTLETKDLDLICKIFADIMSKIQSVFAEQNHNEEEINHLIAASIIFQMPRLKLVDIESSISNLMAIRELWSLDHQRQHKETEQKVVFLQNLESEIDFSTQKITKKFDTILIVINHLLFDRQVLLELSDQEILYLYNRIKNDELFINSAFPLLEQIYEECKMRFNCSRLSDSGYQILERFQKFESLVRQITDMENKFMEKYLISNNYLGHALVHINNHSENICVFKLTNDKNFISLLDQIDESVRSFNVKGGNPQIKTLDHLRHKLSITLDQTILKKYSELDHFQVEYLKRKYKSFFENALKVTKAQEGFTEYLTTVLNCKLSRDFYLPNATNSLDKIRAMEKERAKIEQTLHEIQLIKALDSTKSNKILSLDFKNKTNEKGINTAEEYIKALIKAIVTECSAFQLEALYKPLLITPLNKTQMLLKTELVHQINIRTSVTKMLKSIFTGSQKEYNKLQDLKKSL